MADLWLDMQPLRHICGLRPFRLFGHDRDHLPPICGTEDALYLPQVDIALAFMGDPGPGLLPIFPESSATKHQVMKAHTQTFHYPSEP